jgi:hypothetical protein
VASGGVGHHFHFQDAKEWKTHVGGVAQKLAELLQPARLEIRPGDCYKYGLSSDGILAWGGLPVYYSSFHLSGAVSYL